jgi:hypothetical protein
MRRSRTSMTGREPEASSRPATIKSMARSSAWLDSGPEVTATEVALGSSTRPTTISPVCPLSGRAGCLNGGPARSAAPLRADTDRDRQTDRRHRQLPILWRIHSGQAWLFLCPHQLNRVPIDRVLVAGADGASRQCVNHPEGHEPRPRPRRQPRTPRRSPRPYGGSWTPPTWPPPPRPGREMVTGDH